jgi:putative inorganic carbon (HCO3(-)) transporter
VNELPPHSSLRPEPAGGRAAERPAVFAVALLAALSAVAPLFAAENTLGYLATSVVALALAGVVLLRGPLLVPDSARPFALLLGGWTAFSLVSLAWAPSFHPAALHALKLATVTLAAAGLAFSPAARSRWQPLLVLAVAVAGLVAALGVGEVLAGRAPLPGWLDPAHHASVKSRAASTYANPNLLAAYLALALPPALGLALAAAETSTAVLAAIPAVAIFAGLVLTFSRGGWVACAAGLALMALLLRRHPARHRLAWLAAALGLVVLAAAGQVVERASTLRSAGELGIHQRVELYRGVLACIRQQPLTGWGLHSFETVYPRFRTVGGYYPLDAHNDLLQVAVETGLPGAALYTLLLLATLAAAWPRAPVAPAGPAPDAVGAGLTAGLLAFATATLFMGSLRYLGLQVPFWLAAALAVARKPAGPMPARRAPAALRGAATAALLLAAGYWSLVWWTDPSRIARDTSLAGANEQVRASIRWMPWRHELHYHLGRLLAAAGQLDASLASFREAERLDPLQSDYARWRAQVLAAAGKPDEALEQVRQALEGDPWSEDYLLLQGRILARQGRLAEAASVLERALTTNEQYLALNRDVYPQVFGTLGAVYQALGRTADARALAERSRALYGADLAPAGTGRH